MKVRVRYFRLLLFFILMSAISRAHHSFEAEFDRKQPVTIEGVISKVRWINPHAWIHIEVKAKNGLEEWKIEAGTPNALFRRGFKKSDILPGMRVIVRGFRAKDGTKKANGSNISFPDGRKLFMSDEAK